MSVIPQRPKGPPLNALRAFEAAARLESFVAAAEELGVTPGAVSQHVKTIEDWAGVQLFQRQAQGVALTPDGRQLARRFTAAFDALAEATHALRNLDPSAEVHIATLPAVAQLWLPARLGRIRAAFPQATFSVTALETPPRLSRDLFDISIFFGPDTGSDDHVVLAEDVIFPVGAPSLGRATDLAGLQLLHDQSWRNDWAFWCAATGTQLGDPTRGPTYSLYSLAVEEAKAGAGALMGHACLIEQALSDGVLQRLSDRSCATGRALRLGLPHAALRRPIVDEVAGMLRAAIT